MSAENKSAVSMNAMNPVESVTREPLVTTGFAFPIPRNALPIARGNPVGPMDAVIPAEPAWEKALAPKKAPAWRPVYPFVMSWLVAMTDAEAHAVHVVRERAAWKEPASRNVSPTVVRLNVETTAAEAHAENAKMGPCVTLESVLKRVFPSVMNLPVETTAVEETAENAKMEPAALTDNVSQPAPPLVTG